MEGSGWLLGTGCKEGCSTGFIEGSGWLLVTGCTEGCSTGCIEVACGIGSALEFLGLQNNVIGVSFSAAFSKSVLRLTGGLLVGLPGLPVFFTW